MSSLLGEKRYSMIMASHILLNGPLESGEKRGQVAGIGAGPVFLLEQKKEEVLVELMECRAYRRVKSYLRVFNCGAKLLYRNLSLVTSFS